MPLTIKEHLILFFWFIFCPKKVAKFQELVLAGMHIKYALKQVYDNK